MRNLIEQRERAFFSVPTKVIYIYSNYQSLYDDMANTGVNITFLNTIPSEEDLIKLTKNHVHTLLICDDKIMELAQSPTMAQSFVRLNHHLRMSSFILLQSSNMSGAKYASEIIRNAHYTIMFKAGQMAHLIRSLGIRLNDYRNLSTAYKQATDGRKYSYLCVNCHPRASDMEKYSTNILPDDGSCMLFIPRDK